MDRRTFVGTAICSRYDFAAAPRRSRAVRAQGPERRPDPWTCSPTGSCWTEVIARLQRKGLNATAVQNPLTSWPASVEATKDVLSWQQGPTVLVAHLFGGMILTEGPASIPRCPPRATSRRAHPMQARITRRSQASIRRRLPPPASSGRTRTVGVGEEAFLRDFGGDLPPEKARLLYAVQAPFKRSLLADKTTQAAWRSKPSFYAVSTVDLHHQSRPATLHGEAHGRKDHRGEGEPPGSHSAARRYRRPDPRSRRTKVVARPDSRLIALTPLPGQAPQERASVSSA